MAMMGITSSASRKMSILPEGGRDFLRRRMMELVGCAIAVLGVLLLMSIFTFNVADPSLNHATGNAPANVMGLPAPTPPTCCCRPSAWRSSLCRSH
jgi:S-DNA-T family DNA segregation ATPase FtsK/SpoIIIE